jgi:5-hydroxyisourate hydrolase
MEDRMGKLSTHVLDITSGKPAAGVVIELHAIELAGRRLLRSVVTNSDGRCDAPLLAGDALLAGAYELVFEAGAYFEAQGVVVPLPRFVDRVTLAFGIANPGENYHVPLLVSPWAYSTYRGS